MKAKHKTVKKSIHEILYELRINKGLNQTDIANILGIRQQTYSTYEKGGSDIPTRHLVTLANFYNVHADYILGNTADWDNSVELNVPFTPEYTLGEFLALCMSLKEKDRNTIYDFAMFLNRRS